MISNSCVACGGMEEGVFVMRFHSEGKEGVTALKTWFSFIPELKGRCMGRRACSCLGSTGDGFRVSRKTAKPVSFCERRGCHGASELRMRKAAFSPCIQTKRLVNYEGIVIKRNEPTLGRQSVTDRKPVSMNHKLFLSCC